METIIKLLTFLENTHQQYFCKKYKKEDLFLQFLFFAYFLSLIKSDLNSVTPRTLLFFSSYSLQSSSDRSTFSNFSPLSIDSISHPDFGENSHGSTPRQSKTTIVFSFPESSEV